MATIKNKVLLNLALLCVVVAFVTVVEVFQKEISQEYAKVAAQQLTDDKVYTTLRTQEGTERVAAFFTWVFFVFVFWFAYKIWIPKDVDKRVNKETKKVDDNVNHLRE